MTREEAIKILKSKMDGSVDTSYEWAEAVRMAIEALKAPTGFISKRDAIEIIKNRIEKSEVGESVDHDQVIADIALFPSAEPPYQYSEAYVKQLRGERDILEEMVKNMAYRPTVDKEYLIDLIQESVYDGEACAKLIDLVDRPTGECRTCGRNADNGGVHEDGRTKCPIQEHYALLLDGYCHLYEPYNCGAKMRGENDDD